MLALAAATTAAAAQAGAPASAPATSPAAASSINWGKPVFTDNFSGTKLNLKSWGVYNDPQANGTGDPRRTKSSVRVRDGFLELIGHYQKPYGDVSGGVANNLNRTYGRWVVRFRADAGAGYAPVVLLWPQGKNAWPANGEIDMAEITHANRHGAGEFLHLGKDHFIGKKIPTSVNFTKWHTLAVDWLPDHVTYWLDGRPLWTVKRRSGSSNYVPSKPFHLALQNDQGCDDSCKPDKATPRQVIMQIDWVKVYAAPRAPTPAALRDPGSKGVRGASYSPDGKTLATADSNGHAYVWGRPANKLRTTLTDPASRGASAVAFSPDSSALAIGDRNGHVYLSSPPAFRQLTDPASKGVTAVAFTTLSHYVAAADANGHTYIWTVATGKLLATLTDPHSKGVRAAAYSPDGRFLATADTNGRTYIWALPDYKLQVTLTDPASKGVTAVAFSPDSSSVASSDGNGRIYLRRTGT
jgi:beta-glucanase (GH16 family)